jgi:hypothetical protein
MRLLPACELTIIIDYVALSFLGNPIASFSPLAGEKVG